LSIFPPSVLKILSHQVFVTFCQWQQHRTILAAENFADANSQKRQSAGVGGAFGEVS